MKYVLSAVLAALFLAGCGEDEVELVKNYTLPDFKSMSIGTAIEGSKKCKSIAWSKEENGGLKTVKMVCNLDMELINARNKEIKADEFKSSQKTMIDTCLDSVKTFYKGKTYDAQGLFKLAKEYCKFSEATFQEVLKTKGKIKFKDIYKIVDCDNKLKEELQKEDSVDYIIENLKEAIYFSQLTVEQYDASIGLKAGEGSPSQATIELNFIVNNDKSASLSDKFKFTALTADGKEDANNKMKSQDLLAGFYER